LRDGWGWTGPHRYNVAALTTITLRAVVAFSVGAGVMDARLRARRVRFLFSLHVYS